MKLPGQTVFSEMGVCFLNMYNIIFRSEIHISVCYAVYYSNEKVFTPTPEEPYFINLLFLTQCIQYDPLLYELLNFVICH